MTTQMIRLNDPPDPRMPDPSQHLERRELRLVLAQAVASLPNAFGSP
jgi:hypothetical protein